MRRAETGAVSGQVVDSGLMSQQQPVHQSTIALTSGREYRLSQTVEEVVQAIEDQRQNNTAAGLVRLTQDLGDAVLVNPVHIVSLETHVSRAPRMY